MEAELLDQRAAQEIQKLVEARLLAAEAERAAVREAAELQEEIKARNEAEGSRGLALT